MYINGNITSTGMSSSSSLSAVFEAVAFAVSVTAASHPGRATARRASERSASAAMLSSSQWAAQRRPAVRTGPVTHDDVTCALRC